ncbi:uncharacterized protein J4E88_001279 [Alternaria novae-zelandiae]|uniref:uncharacterized protein n=1 Tax=Alternaria novae-zelandiae TaxID=430562 RepID=UPI0020C3AB10|nr:uncharacterized protein J4E88_001279 [Alternaria novae-zelandiae]KAI4692909.1 hypothetical protein J4E88_001279 [Alternaria novae-zelandiae]
MPSPKTAQGSKSSTMSFKSTSAVTIRVGKDPNTEDFIAHESFLTSRSEFFRRAMNGNWQEADTRTINFPDDDPGTFALYLNHLYTGQLPIATETEEELKKLTTGDFITVVTKQYDNVLRVFVLGEKLQDLSTKNAMMEAALATTKLTGQHGKRQAPSAQTINMVYKGTPSSSLARCLLVDIWTGLPISSIFEHFNQIHEDVQKDLGRSVSDRYKVVSANIGNIPEEKGIVAYQEKPKGA